MHSKQRTLSAESNLTKENTTNYGYRDSTYVSNSSTNKATLDRAIKSPKQLPNLNKAILGMKGSKNTINI